MLTEKQSIQKAHNRYSYFFSIFDERKMYTFLFSKIALFFPSFLITVILTTDTDREI